MSETKWYVVHTYSGHENKVKTNIEKIVENRGMQDLIFEVSIPTKEEVEIKDGKKKVKVKKIYPGYVIIKMVMTDESWYVVRNTRGVTGFVGPTSGPVPLTDEEVYEMGLETNIVNIDVTVGESVRVISGPFENFIGQITDIDTANQIVKLMINIFGRETPIELQYNQIVKI